MNLEKRTLRPATTYDLVHLARTNNGVNQYLNLLIIVTIIDSFFIFLFWNILVPEQ